MSNSNKRDIVESAVYAAAIMELIGAAKIGMLWIMQEDTVPKTKAYLKDNFEILRTNFTK